MSRDDQEREGVQVRDSPRPQRAGNGSTHSWLLSKYVQVLKLREPRAFKRNSVLMHQGFLSKLISCLRL